jgi:CubicO group peptidase (beta-lactamase class C family)
MNRMRKRVAAVVAAMAAFGLAACTAASSSSALPAPIGQPPTDFVSWINHEMKTYQIPGASIAVVHDYTIQWASGFGLADTSTGRRVTTGTPFQTASVSKPIAAIGIIQSFADHGVSLSAPIQPITFPDASTWTLPNPYPQPVTSTELLSHTAGIVSFHYSGFSPGQVLPTLEQELNGEPPATTPPVTVVAEPGTIWSYAPGGYTILQAEVQQQNDWRPFDEIMDQYLLDKFPGLQSSSFAAPPGAALAEKMAVPYLPDGSPLPNGPRLFNTEAAGSMVSTPTDMARIMIAFQEALAGKQTAIPVSVAREMMVRQPGLIPNGECLATAEPGVSACKAAQGLGFDVNVDWTFINHIPDDQPTGNWFGHSGFNSGYLTFFLASKTGGDGFVLMVNSAPADMTTSAIPEFGFMAEVVKRISEEQGWQG